MTTTPLLRLPRTPTHDLRAWIQSASRPRATIQLPLVRRGTNLSQNETQRDQLARELETLLTRIGVEAAPWSARLRATDVEPRDLAPSVAALVILADAHGQRVVPVHAPLPRRLVVGDAFALRPLLAALARSSPYRLLTVSDHRVALFEGDPTGLAPTDRGLPKSLEDALGSETTEKELRVRGTRAGGGAPLFYSHGSGREERELDATRFHAALVASIEALLPEDGVPLVLAGADRHQDALRRAIKLPGVLAEGLSGNVDTLGPTELHARAWPIVERWCAAQVESAAEGYEHACRRGKGLDVLDDVAAAAAAGRVWRLWVDEDRSVAAGIDRATGRTLPGTDENDALDVLVELVLAHGGDVIPVAARFLPSASGVAARLH